MRRVYVIEGRKKDKWKAICVITGKRKAVDLFDDFIATPRWRGRYRLRNHTTDKVVKEGRRDWI